MTIEQALNKIEKAVSPRELFDTANPEKAYKVWARLVHPDVVRAELKDRATRAFSKMSQWYANLTKIPASAPVAIGEWTVKSPLAKGDICDLYLVESKNVSDAVLKIVRDSADEDLAVSEWAALRDLQNWKGIKGKEKDGFLQYFPKPIKTFLASDRHAIVMNSATGFMTLKDIHELYPHGLDFRHVVWMMNRLLSALGYAHNVGIVHGAITPEHLMYHPEDHDLRLVDWCYSAREHVPVPAIVTAYRDLYPPEILRKMEPRPQSDIYMAAKTLTSVAANIPKRFKPFLEWCTMESPNARPGTKVDAWDLKERWKALAQEEYGPPAYVKLKIPVN